MRPGRRSADILAALLDAPALVEAFIRIEAAGCKVLPDWAQGAVILATLRSRNASGVELRAHHVVAAPGDQASVEAALAEKPKRRRPQVHVVTEQASEAQEPPAGGNPLAQMAKDMRPGLESSGQRPGTHWMKRRF